MKLVKYIECWIGKDILLFNLAVLHSLYVSHLRIIGIHKVTNKTQLEEELLMRFPEAQEQFDGRNVIVVFKRGMKGMLREAIKKCDYTVNACA